VSIVVVEHTLPEKILLAAAQLEQAGQSPFSAEALIVSAWQQYPRTFGLKGYTDQYPDANKVLTSIMGEKGLARRGWLVKMGQKLYSLTREGRQMVRRLKNEEEPATPVEAPVSLPAELDRLVQTLLGSTALIKFREGDKADLNFADACRFWNVTEHLRAEELDRRLEALTTGMAEAARLVGEAGARLTNGRTVTADDAQALGDLHEYLEDRFSRHLALLRNRAVRH
jgi:hypothetical protein